MSSDVFRPGELALMDLLGERYLVKIVYRLACEESHCDREHGDQLYRVEVILGAGLKRARPPVSKIKAYSSFLTKLVSQALANRSRDRDESRSLQEG